MYRFTQAPYCTGDTPSFANICLIPQLYNADRWGVSRARCERIDAVAAACAKHPAFAAAHPEASARAGSAAGTGRTEDDRST